MKTANDKSRFEDFLAALRQQSIEGLSFLFVVRSDYIGLVEKLSLPPVGQNTNWKEVPPFTEMAAREFMQGSGLQFDGKLMRDVLREAAEIEQTKGIVRPVTINLCGLVLGRFANGVPRGFRGGLIRAFLRESILLPSIRDVAPRLLPRMISSYVTKRPRSIEELSKETNIDSAAVRGCLRVLGQEDRAIVRPLNESQETWEISHDFLVPMLDSILIRWTVSLWRRARPWLPWVGAAAMGLGAIAVSNMKSDPRELMNIGWNIQPTDNGIVAKIQYPDKISSLEPLSGLNLYALDISGAKIKSLKPLQEFKRLSELNISQTEVTDLTPLSKLHALSKLDLSGTRVTDLTPLNGLTNLESLSIEGEGISNLEPLGKLTSLRHVTLHGQRITDLGPLSPLTDLRFLSLSGPISNLEPLKDLENLEFLWVFGTDITNLDGLKKLKKLKSLVVSHSPHLSNLEGLRGQLDELEHLVLDGTSVSDLEPLEGLKSLTGLSLTDSAVTTLKPLEKLSNMRSLTIEGPLISDLGPLHKLINLEDLTITRTSVTSLEPLRGLRLRMLKIEQTPVADLQPLKSLRLLEQLTLKETKASWDSIADLEGVLRNLKVSTY